MFKFLGHRNFILPLAFVLGLTCSQLAQWTKSLTIPALALVMTVSIVQIPTRQMLKWQSLAQPYQNLQQSFHHSQITPMSRGESFLFSNSLTFSGKPIGLEEFLNRIVEVLGIIRYYYRQTS